MGRSFRSERIGIEIRKIVSDMLLKELKDPALSGMVSVTAVDVTKDGSYAKIYLSVLAPGESQEEAEARLLAGMDKASGFIRREIGHRMDLRRVPELIFTMDESMKYGLHMDEVLADVARKDAENRRARGEEDEAPEGSEAEEE